MTTAQRPDACKTQWESGGASHHNCGMSANHLGRHVCTCGSEKDSGQSATRTSVSSVSRQMSGRYDSYMEAMQDVYDRMREHLIQEAYQGGEGMPHTDAVEWVDDQLDSFELFPIHKA